MPAIESASARFSARCTCRQNCCVFRCAWRLSDRLPFPSPYRISAKSASTNSAPLPRRSLRFTKAPFCTHARRAGRRTDAHAASTNKLKDGANPADRLDLDGGERAQRHRAMCNRRHNLLPCWVELGISGAGCLSPQPIIAISLVWSKSGVVCRSAPNCCANRLS
jgi:hypothetical protein